MLIIDRIDPSSPFFTEQKNGFLRDNSPAMNASPKVPQIPLKNPVVAALLAFLVPGAGHFYQGRTFKGIIYFVCILTLFIWGMQMGHWHLLYRLQPNNSHFQMGNHPNDFVQAAEFDDFRPQFELQAPSRANAKTHWGYFAQLPVGLFSIPAFIQEERYYKNENAPSSPESLQSDQPIEGRLFYLDEDREIRTLTLTGLLEFAPEQGEFGRELKGTFRGQSDEGKDFEIELSGQAVIDAPIGAAPYRELRVGASRLNDEALMEGVLVAKTHRSALNSFLVPPDFSHLESLHYVLGKKFTLAEVFTWIAGLLNVLAIWDAFGGPAYGYRLPLRSEEEDAKKEKKTEEEAEKEPTPSPASSGTA